jgi:POT family proton-dependent oligopeptide transporter
MNIVIVLGVLVTLATGIPVLLQMRNHPKGLFILFFAEMWERFSYYGMRGILIFYLTQHFLFKDDYASGLYGSYTSLVYLLPLLAQGSYEMKETRNPTYVNIFFLAISLIIMGVGFLKPNISTIVGQLYPEGDPRRDPGFTLYYYGINMGAFWASVLCGYLGQTFGWGWGFGLAGAGMLLGYIVFVLGKPLLEGKGEPPHPEKLAKPIIGPLNQENLIYLAGILGVGVVWMLVQSNACRTTCAGSTWASPPPRPSRSTPASS